MIRVLVLGPVSIEVDGAVQPLGSPMQRRLLAALAAARPGAVDRYKLVDALWDDPPRSANATLSAHVSRLRAVLGRDAIIAEAGAYRLDVPTDAEAFDVALDDEPAAADLDAALALWRGSAFGDAAAEPLVVVAASRMEARRFEAEVARAAAWLETDPVRAIPVGEALVAAHPLDERGHVLLVQALGAAGRQADALRAVVRARTDLGAAGLEGSVALAAAERAVLGLEQASTTGRPGELPHPVASFIARTNELDRLLSALGGHRWVTVVGPGGVGKTRLAVEAAHHLSGGGTPCRFVDLSGVAPEDLASAVAVAVGAPTLPPVEDRLVDTCQRGPLLLVLDNVEHLADRLTRLGTSLLTATSDLTVLATSRRRIGVPGEHRLELGPLLPADASSLLQTRVESAGSELTAAEDEVMRLCERLDHLPLAIEMAASLLPSMTVADILDRLDHRLDLLRGHSRGQQRSLRDIIESSLATLDLPGRIAHRRLAVFTGPFTLGQAEEVIGWGALDAVAVPRVLATLRDHSLVNRAGDGSRLRLLDTLRTHAIEQLDASGDAKITRDRHARAHATALEQLDREVRGPDELALVAVLQDEIVDVRAGHSWALRRLPHVAVRIAASLWSIVYDRVRPDLAAWATETLEEVDPASDPLGAKLLAVDALGAFQVGDLNRAVTQATVALDLGEAAHAHQLLANVHLHLGDLDAAAAHARSAAHTRASLNDPHLHVISLLLEALALAYAGDLERSCRIAEEVRAIADQAGAGPTLLAYANYLQGEVLADHDPDAALTWLDRALAYAEAGAGAMARGTSLLTATSLRARAGNPAGAHGSFADAITHWRLHGDWAHQWVTLRNLVYLLYRAGQHQDAAELLGAVNTHAAPAFGAEAERLRWVEEGLRTQLDNTQVTEALSLGATRNGQELLEWCLARTGPAGDRSAPTLGESSAAGARSRRRS